MLIAICPHWALMVRIFKVQFWSDSFRNLKLCKLQYHSVNFLLFTDEEWIQSLVWSVELFAEEAQHEREVHGISLLEKNWKTHILQTWADFSAK